MGSSLPSSTPPPWTWSSTSPRASVDALGSRRCPRSSSCCASPTPAPTPPRWRSRWTRRSPNTSSAKPAFGHLPRSPCGRGRSACRRTSRSPRSSSPCTRAAPKACWSRASLVTRRSSVRSCGRSGSATASRSSSRPSCPVESSPWVYSAKSARARCARWRSSSPNPRRSCRSTRTPTSSKASPSPSRCPPRWTPSSSESSCERRCGPSGRSDAVT